MSQVHSRPHNVAFHRTEGLDQNISEWLWRASPGPWCSSEKAFLMRSSRLPAKAKALGSLDDSSWVDVVDGSTGGAAVLALLRRSRST